ncbi:putative protein NEOXANTHIN-DEFICIENT 1 [Cocos nucifera]|uniref:Uncharacterized protein n=1 Tax=Cocos nucifera TaxID=13894 RepID=A0A8K0NBX3_COCNU|nr:putative protein NEOXANTHIN-DEFICIENT 1 [Cocos nucifera]
MILVMAVPKSKTSEKWMGPMIRMSLPSFSGQTEHNPQLLKYSCQIECRVRAVEAAKISKPKTIDADDGHDTKFSNQGSNCFAEDEAWNRSISVLLSKPILALEFNFLKMQVEAPAVLVSHLKKNQLEESRSH